jgi:hypothetical protein
LPPEKANAQEEEMLKLLESPARATTDAEGKYRFTLNLAPGARCKFVQVRAEGYGPDQFEFAEPPPPTVAGTLRLVKDDVPIRGRVLDLEGRPVPGVKATLFDVEVPPGDDLDTYLKEYKASVLDSRGKTRHIYGGPPLTQPVNAGPDGRFTLQGVGRDRIAIVSIEGPGMEKMQVRVLTRQKVDVKSLPRPGQDAPVDTPTYPATFDHLVSPTRLIVGTVREQGTGKPLAGVRVTGMVWGKNVRSSTVTDAEGKYRLTGLSKAQKRPVFLYPPDTMPYLTAAREVPDTEGLTAQTADFTLVRGVVLTGRVIDKSTGKPTRGFVRYVPLTGNASVKEVPDPATRYDRTGHTTGPDGRFRLVVMRGPGILMVQGAGEQAFRPAGPPNDAREKALLNLNPDGSFFTAFGDVEFVNNQHALRVLNPGKDTETLDLEVTLDPGRTARVKVVDPEGKPVTGVIGTGLTALEMMGRPHTQAAAEFPVSALDPAKPRRLVLWHWQRKLVGQTTLRGDEAGPVEVRLVQGGSATGRLVDAEGKPLVEAVVRYGYRDASYQRIKPEFFGENLPSVLTDKEGHFRLDGLVPDLGTYAVLEPAAKGQKYFSCLRPTRELLVFTSQKAVAWKVRSGATEDLGDVLVQPIKE